MSNAGQAILTVVGTVVGAYFGYPQLGFVLGSLAGQALFPTQLPSVTGPKLTDRNTTSAQVGDPVVWIFGDDYSPGTVIWLDELETVAKTESQGKGGPSQDFTTFSYFQSIAIGICGNYPTEADGPGTKTLLAVWENGKLFYDVRAQRDAEPDVDYGARLGSSAVYAETFVYYNGAEDQLPDPTIEAVRGIGNTPGFRGLNYIVFPRRQLLDSQAQRHPSFRFLVGSCNPDFESLKVFTDNGTWRKPSGLVSATVLAIGAGGGAGSGCVGGGAADRAAGGGGGGGGASLETFTAAELASTVAVSVGFGGIGGARTHVVAPFNPGMPPPGYGDHGTNGGESSFGGLVVAQGGFAGKGGGTVTDFNPNPGPGSDGSKGGVGTLAYGGDGGLGPAGNGNNGEDTIATPVSLGFPGKPAGAGGGSGGGGGNNSPQGIGGDGGSGEIDGDGHGAEGGAGGVVTSEPPDTDGSFGEAGASGQVSNISHGGGGGGGGRYPPLGRNTSGGDGGNGGAYGGGGGGGACASAYGNGINDDGTSGRGGNGARGIVVVMQEFGGSPCDQVGSIGRWVRAICERSGLLAVDTETIDGVFAGGYALARQLTGRAAIDPLRSVGWFDCCESARQLKFVRRGRPTVATIETDDLGAHEFGGTPIPAITTKRAQPEELPRLLRLHYFAISRDYEFGEALSPARISTPATNEIDVELAVAISDQLAAEIVEALWADAWVGASSHETSVGRNWIELEPTDPVIVPVDGEFQRMRIISIVDSSIMLRKMMLVRDDDDSVVTVATAVPPERPPSTIAIKAPTLLIPLDLPPLRPEDDNPGIYAAVAPGSGSQWGGAVIYRSCDGGLTWTPLTDGMVETLIGSLVDALPAAPITEIPDLGDTLVIELEDWTIPTPASCTLEEMLEGANAAAIGQPGRWEVLQFQTAEQTGPTEWALTGLLRGRRGTEHVMGSSVAGDRFVLLNPATIARLPVDEAMIGEICTYRPITFATTFESGADQEIEVEHEGVALLPFSPVDVAAMRELSGDITITWNRRDRIGQTLPDDGILPMSEDTEAYQIDVVDLGNVIRTLISTVPTVTYTAAQQATDSASPTGLVFLIYQISAVLGRGSAGGGTLAP